MENRKADWLNKNKN